jgi:Uma2 family endonuclease
METAVEKRVWTEEELMRVQHDGNKCELIDGELVMSPVTFLHDLLVVRFASLLEWFVRKRKLGAVVGSNAGFIMKSGNVRCPDVSFVSAECIRRAKRPLDKFFEGAPDLAIEVLSPSDTLEGLHEKILEYFESGTKLVWVVNMVEKTILVYHSPTPDSLLKETDILYGENVIPEFTLSLTELFEAIAL